MQVGRGVVMPEKINEGKEQSSRGEGRKKGKQREKRREKKRNRDRDRFGGWFFPRTVSNNVQVMVRQDQLKNTSKSSN